MNPQKKTTLTILIGVILLALILAIGFSLGKKQGANETKRNLTPLLNYAFPPPPAEIKTLSGKVTGLSGATIYLEVADPNDYLPHTDGTPRATETRYVGVTKDTAIRLLNYGRIDRQGLPQITALKLSDLKVGDAITVQSEENIKNAEKFDATEINLVKYQ